MSVGDTGTAGAIDSSVPSSFLPLAASRCAVNSSTWLMKALKISAGKVPPAATEAVDKARAAIKAGTLEVPFVPAKK